MGRFNFQKKTKPALQEKEFLHCLNYLHEKFVVLPIDKSSNKFAIIICKMLNVQKLSLEVGMHCDHSKTSHLSKTCFTDAISNNLQYCEHLGYETREGNKSLPFMCCIPKLHYAASRARFATASSNTALYQSAKLCPNHSKIFLSKLVVFTRRAPFSKITTGFG